MDYEILKAGLANLHWFENLFLATSIVGALFFINRQNKADRKEFRAEVKDFHTAIRDFHAAMRDFHGRLCTLEQKYIDMMERMLERK